MVKERQLEARRRGVEEGGEAARGGGGTRLARAGLRGARPRGSARHGAEGSCQEGRGGGVARRGGDEGCEEGFPSEEPESSEWCGGGVSRSKGTYRRLLESIDRKVRQSARASRLYRMALWVRVTSHSGRMFMYLCRRKRCVTSIYPPTDHTTDWYRLLEL